jgi:hypothetical protein
MNLHTPILLLIFNRPEKAMKVLDSIRTTRPTKLYISADGPRNDEEKELTDLTRTKILENVDWDCEIKTLFREKNLGCKIAVSEGITWFFKHENMGIILEDDCVPITDFYRFCEEMLRKYKNDPRISSISGSNPFIDKPPINYSYFFSRYNRIWGWATWRRAWSMFDVYMLNWPEVKKNKIHYGFFTDLREVKHFERIWDMCYSNKIDTWDYQWFFTKKMMSSLTLVSNENLIQNIGFDKSGTHIRKEKLGLNMNTVKEIAFPLTHPKFIVSNYEIDEATKKLRLGSKYYKLKNYVKEIISVI